MREEEEGKNKKETTGTFGRKDENIVNLEEEVLLFENSKWLKTREAAEYLRTSPKQIRKWVYQGRMKAYKLLGKSLRFKKSDLDLLIEGGQAWL